MYLTQVLFYVYCVQNVLHFSVMVINHEKTRKRSFDPRTHLLFQAWIKYSIHEAKLLHVQFTCTLSFTEHVYTVLKLCSQCLYLLNYCVISACREIVWIACFTP